MPSYTNVSKPTGAGYTNVNSSGKESFNDAGVTFDQQSTFFDGVNNAVYTNSSKPTFSNSSSLLQSAKGYTGSTPLAISYTNSVTKGNLLVACSSRVVSNFSISDSQNNTWLTALDFQTTSKTYDAGYSSAQIAIYYALANSTGAVTVTFTGGDPGADVGGSIYEYSGLDPVVMATSTSENGATLTPTASTMGVSGKNTIIAMASSENTPTSFSACGGGFTLREHNDSHIDAVADRENVTDGDYAAIFNAANNQPWIVGQVAFPVSSYTRVNKPT